MPQKYLQAFFKIRTDLKNINSVPALGPLMQNQLRVFAFSDF